MLAEKIWNRKEKEKEEEGKFIEELKNVKS